jgi:hypothetical protein
MTFPEADWKTLRGMSNVLLKRASSRALDRVEKIIEQQEEDPHKTYIKLWRVLEDEDRKIARVFNDMKRSNALMKLLDMVSYGLLTTDELDKYTKETKERLETITGANKSL